MISDWGKVYIFFMEKTRFFEILRFCIVGGLSFLLDFGLLYVLTEYGSIDYLYSSAISFTTSLIFNYWLCVKFVFTFSGKPSPRQATLFMGSSLAGLGLNQLCMWIFVEKMGIFYLVAKILATIVVTAWNYVIKRKAVQI